MNKWKETEVDMWGDIAWECPYCDFTLYLSNGTPKENQFYFCPKCGKQLMNEVENALDSN